MKITKALPIVTLAAKNTTNNTRYIVQEAQSFDEVRLKVSL